MNKKYLVTRLVFLSLSFIIGFGLSVQRNNSEFTGSGQSVSEAAAHLQGELTTLRDRREVVENNISEVEEKIKAIKGSRAESDEVYQNLLQEIEQYELRAGLVKAQGPGVTVDFMTGDPEQFKILAINYDLLISVINKLNAAGAEGIAINEERITLLTDIRYDQGNLYVNNNPIGKTVQIKAVGDPDTLEATLNMKYGILWEIKNNFNIKSKVEKRDTVELRKYTQDIEFKYTEIQD